MNRPKFKGKRYAGSCAVCLQGTDTALAFQGSPEWCCAGLVALGVPSSEAVASFEAAFPVRTDPMIATIRVCSSCTRKSTAGFPDPVLLIDGASIPLIRGVGL